MKWKSIYCATFILSVIFVGHNLSLSKKTDDASTLALILNSMQDAGVSKETSKDKETLDLILNTVQETKSSVDLILSNMQEAKVSNNDSISNKKSSPAAVSSKIAFRDDIFRASKVGYWMGPEMIWDGLIANGVKMMEDNGYSKHLVTFEVGAHSAGQSIDAVKAKFDTHIFEPSPASYERIKRSMAGVIRENGEIEKYLHLHNVAVGSTTGDMLDFAASGGTGDHVGEFDIWNMKPGATTDEKLKAKSGTLVKIPSMKLDDLIFHHSIEKEAPIEEVYALKVDTQGFEPHVFSGLEESIKNHKIQYILTEYWPNGMALMNNRSDKCDLAVETLSPIVSAGYSIYALPITVHASVKGVARKINEQWQKRSFDDLRADCEYLLNLEKTYYNPDYHMVSKYTFLNPLSL